MQLKKIGLIGGMSFESSAVYYRMINEAVNKRLGALHSAEILLNSVNFQAVVDLQKAGLWDEAGVLLANAARDLARGGADCILLCTNTMHLVADDLAAVAAACNVPFIHIVDETAKALNAAGKTKPLLLATRYTMEHGFYQARMTQHNIAISVPGPEDKTLVHDIIFNELTTGKVLASSREALIAIIHKAKLAGADSVILGCTELCLILDTTALPLAGFDSTDRKSVV